MILEPRNTGVCLTEGAEDLRAHMDQTGVQIEPAQIINTKKSDYSCFSFIIKTKNFRLNNKLCKLVED